MGSHVDSLNQLPLDAAVSIDRTCDRFESAFRAEAQPQIEDFLLDQPPAIRRQLFCELLSLEIHLRLKHGGEKTLAIGDYCGRFREWQDEVELVFRATLTPASARSASSPRPKLSDISRSGLPEKLDLPQQLGAYRVESFLAEGGMGTVYRAVHLSLDRPVAFKVMRSQRIKNVEALSRFQREMRAVARLNHPNIVMAYDAGEVDGLHYLAMELITGWDLARVCECCGTLPIPVACECIRQAFHNTRKRELSPSP